MFSIKADLIRLALGTLLFSASSFWLFEFAGAFLMLMSMANFAIHAFAPEIVRNVSTKYAAQARKDKEFTDKTLALLTTFDAHGDVIPTEQDKALARRMH